MKRLFYLTLGIAAGAYTSYRLSRVAEAWTPTGIADGAAGLGASIREVAGEIRADAAEREAELRRVAGLDELPYVGGELPPARPRPYDLPPPREHDPARYRGSTDEHDHEHTTTSR